MGKSVLGKLSVALVIHNLIWSLAKTLERDWDQGLEYTGMTGEAPVLSCVMRDRQKRLPARPQRAKTGGVPSGVR